MTGRLATCSCGAQMLWCRNSKTDNPNPLDLAPLDDAEIGVGIVAFNPFRGTGHTLTKADVDEGKPAEWAALGVTFHRNHFMTCPNKEQYKRNQPPEGATA